MKRFEIRYNPYNNRIKFRQGIVNVDSDSFEWAELEGDSSFLKFQKHRCIFENCVEEIIELINQFINTSGELAIEFIGTDEDFGVLKTAIACSKEEKSKGITCECTHRYLSANEVIARIREAYEQIKSEFEDCVDNADLSEDDDRVVMSKAIARFQETVNEDINICVIGNYSVGKSALVNAFVGYELLPSHANSTTAKNVQVRNGNKFCLNFVYSNTQYNLSVLGSNISISCNGEKDNEILEELLIGIEGLESEERIIHQIVENLNVETSEDSKIAKIEGTVEITVPFRNSELDIAKYPFVFIDTPGSNNGNEAQRIHRENLEKLMDEQTNALPVFVMGRNSLDSNDAKDLRTLLERKDAGFALQNCVIAISMSDQLVEQQLAEEMPEKIRQWMNHPTILYVSPVAAIGEKKEDKNNWIDDAYRQIYEKKVGDLIETVPPRYNATPCGRTISERRIKELSPLLYASGLPSLETEINYYAYRFAEFKKCTNGREYLLSAMILAHKNLQTSKNALEEDKAAKIQEQETVRKAILGKINSIKLPTVEGVIRKVRTEYDSIVKDYCSTVLEYARSTWQSCKEKGLQQLEFEKIMAEHCQTNLYDEHIADIKARIESMLLEMTEKYIVSVKRCVTDGYGKISEEAKAELDALFTTSADGPKLTTIKIGLFQRISLGFWASFSTKYANEKFATKYAQNFVQSITGSGSGLGVFAKQCIQQPAIAYSKQIISWSSTFKASIAETLNKDNAILSELDDKIEVMENMIQDMENRLNNLKSVNVMLESILPKEEE